MALAAEHFEKAWRLKPERRRVLVDLGRALQALGRPEEAMAALLAASRGGEAHAAEAARRFLPARYPYVYEFRQALALDPGNVELRRELAFLLLQMDLRDEAEAELQIVTGTAPDDQLGAAQLGFLYLARNVAAAAMPLLDRALKGPDAELANRVRAVLRQPQLAGSGLPAQPLAEAFEVKLMAERSYSAGYLKDALRYLHAARRLDPSDFTVPLKLGWTYNILRQDRDAFEWFGVARRSPDRLVAQEAAGAWRNLRPEHAPVRFSAWFLPVYSSRWRDVFSYGQLRTEWNWRRLPVRPYLSENSVVLAVGAASRTWQGLTFWGEAGSAVSYLDRRVLPDYRGGVALWRTFGHPIFFETVYDGVYVSRLGDNLLLYAQNRAGYNLPPVRGLANLQSRLYWNGNLTVDSRREPWANAFETGPGFRFGWVGPSYSFLLSVDYLRGRYTVGRGNPFPPRFSDLRVSLWYGYQY